MKANKITNIEKMLKVENVSDLNPKIISFIFNANAKDIINAEAVKVAKRMAGKLDWQGIVDRVDSYSGMAQKINKINTNMKVKEYPHGNGYSTYVIA